MTSRPHYQSLNYKMKMELIKDREDKKMSYAELAKKYNVAYSSITGIVKQKNLILRKSMHKSTNKLCRERNPKSGSLEKKLFDEFTRVTPFGFPLHLSPSGPVDFFALQSPLQWRVSTRPLAQMPTVRRRL